MNGQFVIARTRLDVVAGTKQSFRTECFATLAMTGLLIFPLSLAWAAPATDTVMPGNKSITPDEMEIQIKGQFKGRLLVKKIVAPVTMNLEKLQDFPEDPSQKILLDPLPISQYAV